jgi:hypothetical protein
MATWITSPFESTESNNLVLVSVRTDVDKFRKNPKFEYRIEVSWTYTGDSKGMPDLDTAQQMEQVQEALDKTFTKDPVAVMTDIYTGDNVREYVFYTLSLHIFQRKFNEALSSFPTLPLSFNAEEDSKWEQYADLLATVKAIDANSGDFDDDGDDLDPADEE